MSLAITLIGAMGRMGTRLLHLISSDSEFRLSGAVVSPYSPHLGKDAGESIGKGPFGINLEQDLNRSIEDADVLMDFSTFQCLENNLCIAQEHFKPIIIGTTGHSEEGKKHIADAARVIPVLFSPNFSLGMSICMEVTKQIANALKEECIVDVLETHHVHKKDRPSGTALAIAEALNLPKISLNPSFRDKDTLVIHSKREGEVIGEHSVIFSCGEERIEIKHEVLSRDAFAKGALKAAKFLANKPAGLYTLKDLFYYE